jgi:allantoinase
MQRDFLGYGDKPPEMRWPSNAGLAVSVVLNIEEGAELSLAAGDEKNEAVHEVVQEVHGAPDLCLASHFEYGTRVGYRRIIDVAAEHAVPLTLNSCARSLIGVPWLARDAIARGHEICSHGWRWEANEILRVSGVAPTGWHTKSSASVNTRRLLVEHGGFHYDSDAYNDDLPYYLVVNKRPHLVLPYCFDNNDMRFFGSHAFVKGSDFSDYIIDSFDWMLRESKHQPKMMSIGLHLRIIGRAGRIAGLDTVFKHIRQSQGVWMARRDEIAKHWRQAVPPEV